MQNTIPYPIDEAEEDFFDEEEPEVDDDEEMIDEDYYTDSLKTQYQEYKD